ncbi:hypothetical protein AMTR_s00010p00225560 [Amborella trichopoda]|uniref:Uncharacterized protein n=1 Tax=Amborella trichopoda TaxID=13333 RepID=W1NFM3_AMBTC|nr:hypothetical protein AMTR_s00010p00225560 [Amborella trichopoda]
MYAEALVNTPSLPPAHDALLPACSIVPSSSPSTQVSTILSPHPGGPIKVAVSRAFLSHPGTSLSSSSLFIPPHSISSSYGAPLSSHPSNPGPSTCPSTLPLAGPRSPFASAANPPSLISIIHPKPQDFAPCSIGPSSLSSPILPLSSSNCKPQPETMLPLQHTLSPAPSPSPQLPLPPPLLASPSTNGYISKQTALASPSLPPPPPPLVCYHTAGNRLPSNVARL